MAETRDLFTDDHATRLKACAGKPYQPANGMEGEMFMERFCYRCSKDTLDMATGQGEGCEIIANTMLLEVDDPEYPTAWVISERGQPVCTEFAAKDASAPVSYPKGESA